MAAANFFSPLFDANGNPVAPNPLRVPAGGCATVPVTHTIPTGAVDETGDFMALWPIPSGATPVALHLESCGSLGAAGVDIDYVLRTVDKNGVVTDVVLIDGAAALFNPVQTSKTYTFYGAAPVRSDDADGIGWVGLKTVVAATPASGIFKGALVYR